MRYTLCENHLYSKAYARGKKFVGRQVIVYILPDYFASKIAKADPQKERHNRVGITATKKLGGAVERNRVKRIIRAGLAETEKNMPIKKGFLIVIVARSSAVGAKSPDIASDLTAAFKKLGLIQNDLNRSEKNPKEIPKSKDS